MHPEAAQFVGSCAELLNPQIGLDVGGRDVNGCCRLLFVGCRWEVLDIEPGLNVDHVADFAEWTTDRRYDVILCTEVFEHVANWSELCRNAFDLLSDGGSFVITAATEPRQPHSAVDGGPLRENEHYANIDPMSLWAQLHEIGFDVRRFVIQCHRTTRRSGWGDIYAMAYKS